jgi:hypothetical protein
MDSGLLTLTVPAGVAALVIKDLFRAFQYRNGSSRRLTEDKVRLIVQQEITPLRNQLGEIGETVAGIAAVQNAQAFRAANGRS